MLRRGFLLGASAVALSAHEAVAQLLFSSAGISGPTGISLSGNVIVDNAPAGTIVGTVSVIGGVAPFTLSVTDDSNFIFSGSNLVRSSTGTLTAGIPENLHVQATDVNGRQLPAPVLETIAVSSHTGSTTITTLTLANTSGSTQATNFLTPLFGHAFKQGDVPTTTYPQFQLSDTTNVPFSMSAAPTYWPDGSLKHASFVLRVPSTIAGSGSLTINVLNGGSAPAASSRALADLSGTDIKMVATGLDNLSGVWTSSLNTGVTANKSDNYVFLDGPAGKMWRIRAPYQQSGSDEGLLEGYHYLFIGQNAAGGLAGFRVLVRTTMPWIEPSTKVFKSFSAFTLQNGATVIRDMVTQRTNTQVFSWSSGNIFTATGNLIETGQLVQLTTTGTLPTGLSLATSYYVYSGDTVSNYPNKCNFGTNSKSITQQVNTITATGAGSGTHTATAYPYLTPFGSLWSAGPTGTYDYIQGGGTIAADSTVRIQKNKTYERSTLVIPAYDLTVSPTSNPTYSWYCNTGGPCAHNTDGTGERLDLGVFPGWYARHVLTQAAVDEQAVRVVGLIGGQFPINLRNNTTNIGHLFPVNNTTYSGLNAPAKTFGWSAGAASTSGMTAPTNANVQLAGFHGMDANHRVAFAYYPFVLTGEPQFLDMILEWSNATVMGYFAPGTTTSVINTTNYAPLGTDANSGSRNVTTSGTTRYGICIFTGENRGDAWALRDIGTAAGICPQAHPECASYWQYFNDLWLNHDGIITDIIALSPTSYASTNGLWLSEASYKQDVWMQAYFLEAISLGYGLNGGTGIFAGMNALNKWWDHVINTISGFTATAEEGLGRKTGSNKGPLIDSDIYITANGGKLGSWTNGSANFTYSSGSNYPTPHVDDQVIFTSPDPPAETTTPVPAAFTIFTPYYVKSVAGQVIQLSATKGGSAIVNTDTHAGNITTWFQPVSPPATGSWTSIGADGYLTRMLGAKKLSKSRGATVDATALADLQGRFDGAGGASLYTANPKCAFATAA